MARPSEPCTAMHSSGTSWSWLMDTARPPEMKAASSNVSSSGCPVQISCPWHPLSVQLPALEGMWRAVYTASPAAEGRGR